MTSGRKMSYRFEIFSLMGVIAFYIKPYIGNIISFVYRFFAIVIIDELLSIDYRVKVFERKRESFMKAILFGILFAFLWFLFVYLFSKHVLSIDIYQKFRPELTPGNLLIEFIFELSQCPYEEIFFRFFLFEGFKERNVPRSLSVLSISFLFGLAHFPDGAWFQSGWAFAFSLIAFLLKELWKENAFYLLVAMHAAFNLIASYWHVLIPGL